MRQKTRDLLLNALRNHGVPAHFHIPVINDVCGPAAIASNAKANDTYDVQWDTLLHKLMYDRRTLTSNRKKWAPELRDIYESYISIMDEVRKRIEAVAHTHTRADVTREAAAINKRRIAEGKRPLASNGTQWQSWVPPHVRQQVLDAVDVAYTKMLRTQGNRWVPFASTVYRREAKARVKHIEASISGIRKMCALPPNGTSNTLYGALLLAGVRMAELELQRRVRGYRDNTINPFDQPIPVHWAQMCSPDMRKRLRDAADNPALIDPTGLAHFYDPKTLPPTDSTHAVAAALDDIPTQDADE